MTIDFKGKKVNIPDGDITKLKNSLDISTQEAVELWLDDHDYTENEEAEKLTKKAKEFRRYEKSDKERKKSTRERKVDENKKFFIEKIVECLESISVQNITVKNEAEISFSNGNDNYTVKLIKHRVKKK